MPCFQRSSSRCWKSVRCSFVHPVVVRFELQRVVHVLADDDLARLGHQPLGELTHLQDRGVQVARHRRHREAQPGELGHMPGEVARPLQVRAHPQRRDDDPQVGRDRLLPGQQGDRPVLQLALEVVDLLVRGDDALRDVQVGVEQRGGGPADRGADQPGHLDQPVTDRVELLVICVAHRCPSVGTEASPPRCHADGPTRTGRASRMNRHPRQGELLATCVREVRLRLVDCLSEPPNLDAWT